MKGGASLIDFQLIRQSTDIEEVAKWLGLEVCSGKTRCPFHQDHTPSLSFKNGRFKCFGCDASGDAIDMFAKLRGLNALEAAQQIIEAFHLDVGAQTSRKPSEFKEPLLQKYIDNTIESFAVTRQAQDYLVSRGFSGESMLLCPYGSAANQLRSLNF